MFPKLIFPLFSCLENISLCLWLWGIKVGFYCGKSTLWDIYLLSSMFLICLILLLYLTSKFVTLGWSFFSMNSPLKQKLFRELPVVFLCCSIRYSSNFFLRLLYYSSYFFLVCNSFLYLISSFLFKSFCYFKSAVIKKISS